MSNVLAARDVCFAYGDRPVLDGVDVDLAGGEVVALLGPNGSGKSTLIGALLGHRRGGGDVRWFGRPVGEWGRRALARRVAYLPQTPSYEVGRRVVDVLRVGRTPYGSVFGVESREDERVVAAVADRLGLTPLLGRAMEALSGGQRQRVFVGRCLVQQPAALLLDEPNTYLDLRHQVELCRLLRELAGDEQIGVLMAVHDLNLAAAFADRVVVLSEGKVAAAGTVDVLRPALLSRVYGVSMSRLAGPNNRPVLVPGV